MPEGPEVRRQADRVHRALAGQVARTVYFAFSQLEGEGRALEGRRVDAVTSRGKALLLCFEGDRWVYTHNQLYGRWYVGRSGKPPNTRRSLRFYVSTGERAAWLYSASTIEVLTSDQIAEHAFLGRLGPDVLDDATDVRVLRARLRDPRFRRRSLGALLLDQRFLAGLGNYLRSEILHRARIGPEQSPQRLSAVEIRRLAGATLEITKRAYQTGGITNDPKSVALAKSRGATRREYRHYVFGRRNRACPRCAVPIVQETHAGRRLYRCPSCQPTAGD